MGRTGLLGALARVLGRGRVVSTRFTCPRCRAECRVRFEMDPDELVPGRPEPESGLSEEILAARKKARMEAVQRTTNGDADVVRRWQ